MNDILVALGVAEPWWEEVIVRFAKLSAMMTGTDSAKLRSDCGARCGSDFGGGYRWPRRGDAIENRARGVSEWSNLDALMA